MLLERIREHLAGAHIGEHPRFTASFGVTDSNAGADLARMIHLADAALYQSKHEGRDRVTVGDDTTTEPPDAGARSSDGFRRHRPSLHDAIDEEDPRPTGLEIR